MVVVPLSKPADDPDSKPESVPGDAEATRANLIRWSAAGALVAGGVLLLSGNRRAGVLTAAAGTTLAMLDQQEAVRQWWNALPVYLDEAQALLGRVQGAIDDIAARREKLRNVLAR